MNGSQQQQAAVTVQHELVGHFVGLFNKHQVAVRWHSLSLYKCNNEQQQAASASVRGNAPA
jgi:hypothetical protein